MGTLKTHKAVNETTQNLIDSSSIRLVSKLGDILAERRITQTELSEVTGIRHASINEMLHDKKKTINKQHLMAIMVALKLKDITDLYEVVFDDERELERLKAINPYVQMDVDEILKED